MKKLRILLLSLIIVGFAAAFVVFFIKFSKNIKNKPPTPFLPNPITNLQTTTGSKYEIKIGKNDFKFPATLPLLMVGREPSNKLDPKNIAVNFSLTNEPQIEDDITESKVYIWSNESYAFVYSENSNKFEYQILDADKIDGVFNKQLKENEYLNEVLTFAKEKFNADPNQLSFYSIEYRCAAPPYVEGAVKCDKTKANIIKVNYSVKYLEYPLLALVPDNSVVSAALLKDGSIYKFQYRVPQQFKAGEEFFKIKDYAAFVKDIGKSAILTYDSEVLLRDDSIEKITVNDAKLAYLADSNKSAVYQPIFVMQGTLKLKDSTDNIEAILYLPAVDQL